MFNLKSKIHFIIKGYAPLRFNKVKRHFVFVGEAYKFVIKKGFKKDNLDEYMNLELFGKENGLIDVVLVRVYHTKWWEFWKDNNWVQEQLSYDIKNGKKVERLNITNDNIGSVRLSINGADLPGVYTDEETARYAYEKLTYDEMVKLRNKKSLDNPSKNISKNDVRSLIKSR